VVALGADTGFQIALDQVIDLHMPPRLFGQHGADR